MKLENCPACYGTGELKVGIIPGQEWPNQGVNVPAGAAVGCSSSAREQIRYMKEHWGIDILHKFFREE